MTPRHHPGGAGDQQVVGADDVPARPPDAAPHADRSVTASPRQSSPGAAPGRRTSPAQQVTEQLATRTREILERPRVEQSEEERAREKQVVHECRYLMRLLSTRRRSEGEMRQRLAEREVPADIAHETMARIARADLIDDAAFAREWVQQRRSLRALGDEALRRELGARRVDAELIEAALADGQSDEEQRCRELIRSRLDHRDRERLREERDGSHRRRLSRRLDALLTRKGYPGDLAVHVIAGELRAAAEDPAA
ncbi:regulatory protein RecX [Brachybacterium sp. GU-2]|uniref:regulatory protein RecX n=1 Tax=Brachybacterium sp. GU-2 TaxID=3069708 RepID=UPI00280B769F|nr:regulatory protein RecX [Brachybacterium sp. GU-2]WME23679.1 regulatory protein RecX [Brachybacterium sp. GU-2]